MEVVMVIELPSILEPDDFGPWFPCGYANEHNFVAQYVLEIEMRGLCYAGTFWVSVVFLGIFWTKVAVWWNSNLAVFCITTNGFLTHSQFVVSSHSTGFGVVTLRQKNKQGKDGWNGPLRQSHLAQPPHVPLPKAPFAFVLFVVFFSDEYYEPQA